MFIDIFTSKFYLDKIIYYFLFISDFVYISGIITKGLLIKVAY